VPSSDSGARAVSIVRFMIRRLLVFWLVGSLLLSESVLACTTIPGLSVKDHLEEATHVLLAEIVGGSRTAQSDNPEDPPAVETVRFKVLVSWKGGLRPGSTLTTITSLGLGSCGLTTDSTHRVLVRAPPSNLETGAIWVLFLGGGSPLELSHGSGSARVGEGGENSLGELYRLVSPRGQP
jgi:hypothetical protein